MALFHDIRSSIRVLSRRPLFAATIIGTLGLGMGASSAIFSLVYGLLVRPLPFPNAERLVQLVQLLPTPTGEVHRAGLTPEQVAEWRYASRTMSDIGYYTTTSADLTNVQKPVRIQGVKVSVNLMRAVGPRPLLGKLFADVEELPGNERVVLLAHDTWTAFCGSDPNIVGKTIYLDEHPYRVIGVMPRAFSFPTLPAGVRSPVTGDIVTIPDFWIPIVTRPRPAGPARGGMTLSPTLALLRPGISVAQATAEAQSLMPARATVRYRVEVVDALAEQRRTVRPMLVMFAGGVSLVLLIACLNVLNLLLIRTTSRRRELAIRVALGASGSQLSREAITDAALLAVGGAGVSVVVAAFILAGIRRLPATVIPPIDGEPLTWVVIGFSTVAAVLVGLAIGAITGLTSSWITQLLPRKSRHANSIMSAIRGPYPARALVMVEIASSFVLVTGAVLLVTSAARLLAVEPGFDTSTVYSFRLGLPASRYTTPEARVGFQERLMSALHAQLSTDLVAASDTAMGREPVGFTLSVGTTPLSAKEGIAYSTVTSQFVRTLGLPLRAGRDLAPEDQSRAPGRVLVNEAFARKYCRSAPNAVGQLISFQDWHNLEIVGVVGDTRFPRLDETPRPHVYIPQSSTDAFIRATYIVRSSGKAGIGDLVRSVVSNIDASVVLSESAGLDTILDQNTRAARMLGTAAAAIGSVAVVLAAMGLYGVLSYDVTRRLREFAVLVALGATKLRVVGTASKDTVWLVCAGLALGTIGTQVASRWLQSILFEVNSHSVGVLIGTAVGYLLIVACVFYIPVRTATRVDPSSLLKVQ